MRDKSTNIGAFTVIELLMGLLVFGILALGLSSIFKTTLTKNKKIRENAMLDNSFKGFSQKFQRLIVGSDVASSFQLLPVRYRDCVRNEGPCFFTINSNGVIGRVAKKHLGGLSGMNFFSDRGIKANNRAFVTKNHPSRIIYYKKPSYPSEVKLSKNKRFYVGWKLKSVNTAPFPMLTRNNFPGFFEFPSALATSKPKDNYVVLKGSAKDLPIKQLEGSLVVIYNGHRTQTYFVKKIENAGSCFANQSFCAKIVRSRNPDNATNADFQKKFLSKTYYYLSLKEPSDTIKFIDNNNVRMVGGWWGQKPSEFIFPFRRTTLYDPSEKGADLRKADPHMLQHYHHTLINPESQAKYESKLIFLPIYLKKISLEKQGKKRKRLIEEIYGKNNYSKILMDDLSLDTEVYFGRQLSTRKVSAFVIRPEDKGN